MSKLPVPTAKNINEAHRAARLSAEAAVEHAIRCGQMLAQRKTELSHGEWLPWLEKNCPDISERQAQRYMAAAAKSDTRVGFDSLRQLLGIESKPPKKQEKPDTSARSVTGAVMNPPESAAQGSEAGNRNTPAGVDAGRVRPPVPAPEKPAEVSPAPDFDFTDYEPEDDDAYKASIENVMMADDKLTAMREELKQCHREIQALKASRDHYQSEAGAAVRLVKARDREIEKLQRLLDKAREEVETLRERVAVVEAA